MQLIHYGTMWWLGVFLLLLISTEAFVSNNKAGKLSLAPSKRAFLPTTSLFASPSTSTTSLLVQGPEVGRGSYGVVHLCDFDNDNDRAVIGKRPFTPLELASHQDPKQRHKRCQYYWNVEQHCFEKMEPHPQVPVFRGIHLDVDDNSWMTFDVVGAANDESQPAPSLDQVMEADWKSQHSEDAHHLLKLQQALGLEDDASFGDILDVVITNILEVLTFVHSQHIVHRDVKPGNLLIAKHKLVLIDFGSAADMDPISKMWKKYRVGLEDGNRVAVSPIYAAPETFIQPDRAPYQFDVFSAALIICQLLFNYLDERTDAGFHQQLEDANWELDTWLSRELNSKVRPAGLEEAMNYLRDRPGLWRLLGDMLRRNPEQRVSSAEALQRWQTLVAGEPFSDGPFFESVIAIMQECEVAPATVQRPLHFVASFRRHVPLGLVLAEPGEEVDDEAWEEATRHAQPGEVFIQSIVEDSQADQMGIFEVGDRLQGVGELPLASRGFETVVQMLEQQPRSAKYVRLHFDRRRAAPKKPVSTTTMDQRARVVAQGAWSVEGRRKTQEDTFVLHEIHEEQDILLAGVFDGHGGTAASHAASQMVPFLLSERLRQQDEHHEDDVRRALEHAWETTCDSYRHGCLNDEECVAEYDPIEGRLQANTGSSDLVAGTTASIVAVQEGAMTVLNCGDSRTVLVGKDGEVVFATDDHTPEFEMNRLTDNPGYSSPKCSMSRWYLSVGDYQYAVARSLEGPFATSKGIVSDPDVTKVPIAEEDILVMASDGLFEVMDNEEVGRDVLQLRAQGFNAGDAAKSLCSLALEKGTSDNVSVVVVYLGP